MPLQQKETLSAALSQLGLVLDEVSQTQLLMYIRLLCKWNDTYNLTALRDEAQMLNYHILDSLSLLPFVEHARTLVDVGSGGGMPGIPVAIARPDLTVTLIDANSKKTAFLQQAVNELGLKNVSVQTARVEALGKQNFDIVTSRAFAELSDFVTVTRQLLAENGKWAAMKGIYPYEEIAQLSSDIKVEGVHEVSVPGINAQRHIVMLKLEAR